VILYVHTVGPVAFARMLIHRGPVIMAAHITPASFLGSIRGAEFLLGLISRYLRLVYNRASVIVAVSAAAAAELALLKVRPPVRVSHNAIDQRDIQDLLRSRESLREQFDWHDQVIVLAVGQIQPRKGVREFIACAEALPHLKFIWVGGMPFGLLSAERARMLHMCSAAPPNVEFAGMKPRYEVFRHYAAADIFFLPSQHETFGLAVLEAAAAGLPLVINDLACYREWLGGAYLAGTSSEEYARHLRKLAQLQFRNVQGELAGHAAAGYGGQALMANLRDTLELATRPRVPPAGARGDPERRLTEPGSR
jgi:1,2-diacylglycerol-3-alpha-glucose alpha-1,2-galactosyltransferase